MIFWISFDLVSLRESVVTDTFINAGSSKKICGIRMQNSNPTSNALFSVLKLGINEVRQKTLLFNNRFKSCL